MGNSMLTLDELKSRNKDKNGHVSDKEFEKMKKCFIFLGILVAVAVIATMIVFL